MTPSSTSLRPLPIVDLQGQYQRLKPELDAAIQSVLDSTAFINGPQVSRFSESLAAYLGNTTVVPCANGTDALQLAYMALDLSPGDEIIIPAFNYVATAEAACLLGLVPVFADVDAETFNLDPHALGKWITPKTRAIVAVHLFGQSCDVEALDEFCRLHGLYLIEDNAQAIGSEIIQGRFAGKKAGTIGILGTTSFFPSKNLGCMGDGGAVFCSTPELAKKVKMLANHGQMVRYQYETIGINSRLDSIQAAVLEVKLSHLPDFTERRQKAARFYDQAFQDLEGIRPPRRAPFSTHVFHQYTLTCSNREIRNRVKETLNEQGIQSMIYYPRSLHLHPAYRSDRFPEGAFPVSEGLCDRVISLPMHTELREEDLLRITDAVRSAVRH